MFPPSYINYYFCVYDSLTDKTDYRWVAPVLKEVFPAMVQEIRENGYYFGFRYTISLVLRPDRGADLKKVSKQSLLTWFNV